MDANVGPSVPDVKSYVAAPVLSLVTVGVGILLVGELVLSPALTTGRLRAGEAELPLI